MIAWALFFAAAFGVSFVLAAAHISLPLREWLSNESLAKQRPSATWLLLLLECPACTGWHAGWLAVAFGLVPLQRDVLHALTLAFATAASNLILARIAGLSKE